MIIKNIIYLAVNYIMHSQEIHDKFQKAWSHFLIAGEVYTHRGVVNNEPFYEVLNPLDVDYDLDPDLEFVDDPLVYKVREA